MLGAIAGDVIGSVYEFSNHRYKEFELLKDDCFFTDDTVMTIAVCEALMDSCPDEDDNDIRERIIDSMKKYGRRYPFCGFGGHFFRWVLGPERKPYNSFGNGSAMRVSSAGWLYDDIETVRRMAVLTADVTHSHPEGIKGAECIASLIFLARNGASKDELRRYAQVEFGYNLEFTCDGIRDTYMFNETCQETVPQAIVSFLEGDDFEDVIRTGVSIGGDTDTLCAIAGSIAEAYYGMPEDIRLRVLEFLEGEDELMKVIDRFVCRISDKK